VVALPGLPARLFHWNTYGTNPHELVTPYVKVIPCIARIKKFMMRLHWVFNMKKDVYLHRYLSA
jgi:hypothetical protein